MSPEERTLEVLLRPAQRLCGGKIPRDRGRFLVPPIRNSPPASPMPSPRPISRCSRRRSRIRPAPPATGWPARSPTCAPRSRTRKPRSSDYRAKSNLFVRLQQYLAAQPAAHRDQFADFRGARAKGRPGGEGAAVARADPLGQADRIPPTSPIPKSMRRLIEQRNALRSQLAEQSTTLARPASAHQGIEGADRRSRARDAHRGRAPGAPARQRRQGRRRQAGNAHRQPRSRSRSSPRRPMSRTCSCARSNARPRPSAICSNPISPNIARRPRATTSMPRRRRRASFRAPARRSSRTIRRNCRPC